ncbi:MAG: PASTA domain-containing protein [Caldisericia bacterium]|nr:PASTA domain-containing protein [Caldisericia bacterium]MDD4613872.1 PASTA domain-containing protein [Caldisericia bacterium]
MGNWKQYFILFLSSVIVAGLLGCKSNQLIDVPDLRGLELHEAEAIVEGLGLVLKVKDATYSSSVPKDTILAQVPFPSTAVKYGRSVSVKISKGSPVILCPDLVGKEYGEAIEILHNVNLYVHRIHEVETYEHKDLPDVETETQEGTEDSQEVALDTLSLSSSAPVVSLGTILKQYPVPGTKMKPGQGVELTIYLPSLPIVPNLLGSHLEDAKYIISHSGYSVGTITFKPNAGFSRGVVYIQEPIPGSPAEKNASISIVVNEESIQKSVGSG